jgi:hypothetical protein
MSRLKNADGSDATTPPAQNFFQRNQKTILIVGAIVIAGLLFLPDAIIRKYVPWVK